MSLDLNGLANYTKENEEVLLTASIMGAKTQARIAEKGNILTGVKTSEKIGVLETDVVFQDGANCAFTPAGTTKITQRSVVVGDIKVQESLCPKELEKKYTQKMLKDGSKQETIPFEEEYTGQKTLLIAGALEKALWQGDTASASPNLNKFDGLIKNNDSSTVNINANTAEYIGTPIDSATGITQANVISVIDAVVKAIPAELRDKPDLEVLCGWDVFTPYTFALRDKNWFHYDAANSNGELVIPGTNIRLVALPGLNDTSRVFALRWSNVFMGTDLEGEDDKFDMFYAKEAKEVRFDANWKSGVNVAFPKEVVTFKLA